MKIYNRVVRPRSEHYNADATDIVFVSTPILIQSIRDILGPVVVQVVVQSPVARLKLLVVEEH